MTTDFEKGVDKVSQEVTKAAEDVKDTMKDVGGRWSKSPLEEKITTIAGVILLARGIWQLRTFFRGIILLILGGLLVSGYFNKGLTSIIKYFSKETKSTKKKEPEEVKKPTHKKPAKKK
jgi:hypothetical protein